MPGLKMNLNCPRRLAVYAVFDVLDTMGAEYARSMVGDIQAKVKVLGKTSGYAFAVTEQSPGTSILHAAMPRPAPGLTEEGKQLALQYLMDSILHHMDQALFPEQLP